MVRISPYSHQNSNSIGMHILITHIPLSLVLRDGSEFIGIVMLDGRKYHGLMAGKRKRSNVITGTIVDERSISIPFSLVLITSAEKGLKARIPFHLFPRDWDYIISSTLVQAQSYDISTESFYQISPRDFHQAHSSLTSYHRTAGTALFCVRMQGWQMIY